MHDGRHIDLSVDLPKDVELDELGLKQYLAAKLYGDGTLSLFEAAKMAEVDKWDMPAILAKYDVPYFRLTSAELERDIRNA